MNCGELELRAIPYLDGKLTRREAEALERHLAECSACAERVQGFSEVRSMLDAWEPVQPSPSFEMRLRQRIAADAASRSGWREWVLGWLPAASFARPALVGAMLSMLLAAVLLARFTPGTAGGDLPIAGGAQTGLAAPSVEDAYDELALYQELPVLENLELLSNFEVLQELQSKAQ